MEYWTVPQKCPSKSNRTGEPRRCKVLSSRHQTKQLSVLILSHSLLRNTHIKRPQFFTTTQFLHRSTRGLWPLRLERCKSSRSTNFKTYARTNSETSSTTTKKSPSSTQMMRFSLCRAITRRIILIRLSLENQIQTWINRVGWTIFLLLRSQSRIIYSLCQYFNKRGKLYSRKTNQTKSLLLGKISQWHSYRC